MFAESVAPAPIAERCRADQPVLPWAVLETATGDKRETGITNAFIDDAGAGAGAPSRPARAPTRPTARGQRPDARTGQSRATGTRPDRTTSRRRRARDATTASRAGDAASQAQETHLTAEGLTTLEAELEQLRTFERPEVILRVKTARELGDLRENAEYEEARNEQSFLEGRIQAIENMVRSAVVIETRPHRRSRPRLDRAGGHRTARR